MKVYKNENLYLIDKNKLYDKIATKYINANKGYKIKLNKFEDVWKTATDIAFAKRNNFSSALKLREDLILEYYEYNSSMLKTMLSKKFKQKSEDWSMIKKTREATKIATIERFKNFRKVYGYDILPNVLYKSGESKAVNIYKMFRDYEKGEITKKELFKQIEYFHDNVMTKNYNSKSYRQLDINAEISRYGNK